jgi:DHA1 family multidrug resistance protein-like MFS transporter
MLFGACCTTEWVVMPDMDLAKPRNDWRILLLVFILAGVVESQAFGHLNAFTPLYLQQLQVPERQIPQWTGILSALAFVIGIPLLPFWGVWADRYSRKIIIVRSAYIEGLLFTVAALAPNVYVLALARFLAGFVLGNTGVMLALLADVTPRQRLGLAVGLASAGFPLGSSIGPFLGGLIAAGPGIRTLLLSDAVASAGVGIRLTLIVHDEPKIRRSSQTAAQGISAAVRDIIYSPVVVRLFLLYFAAMFGYSMVLPFLPLRLQQLYLGPA